MKRTALTLLVLLTAVESMAFHGMGPGPGVKAYGQGGPSPSFSCSGFDICQHFEGAGYDNGESWFSGYNGTESGLIIDPDYTTDKIEGSQSLRMMAGGAGNEGSWAGDYHSASNKMGYFLVAKIKNMPSASTPGGWADVATAWDNAVSQPMAILINSSGNLRLGWGTSGASANPAVAIVDEDTLCLWLDWDRSTTGDNGVVSLYLAAPGQDLSCTKPATPTIAASHHSNTNNKEAFLATVMRESQTDILYDRVLAKVGAFIGNVAGTTTPPDPAPLLVSDPTSWDFGSIEIGTWSDKTFTITNAGDAGAAVTDVAISGTDSARFAVQSEDCDQATVAPQGSCGVTVRYTPGVEASHSASLGITYTVGGPLAVALTGAGYEPAQPPAFPTTSLLDDFNRANEGPPLSSSWTGGISGGLKVISNEAGGHTSGFNAEWWSTSFNADQEVAVTITAGGSGLIELMARTDLNNMNWYSISVIPNNNEVKLYRYDAGTPTQLGATISQTINSGNSIGLSIVGSTLTAWHKTSAGEWTNIGTRSDSTYSAGGRVGLLLHNTATRVDNFGGGNHIAQ